MHKRSYVEWERAKYVTNHDGYGEIESDYFRLGYLLAGYVHVVIGRIGIVGRNGRERGRF